MVSWLKKYLIKKDQETFQMVSIKLVEYLRDKPDRFRVLLEKIDGSTLPILLSCGYSWDDLLMCLRVERDGKSILNVPLAAIESIIFRDYEYLGNQASYYQQLGSILRVVIENTTGLPQKERSTREKLQILMKVRYNQPVDPALLQKIPAWDVAACAVLAKNYELALNFMQNPPGSNFQIIMSDPEF